MKKYTIQTHGHTHKRETTHTTYCVRKKNQLQASTYHCLDAGAEIEYANRAVLSAHEDRVVELVRTHARRLLKERRVRRVHGSGGGERCNQNRQFDTGGRLRTAIEVGTA